jgi:hypothetical protein
MLYTLQVHLQSNARHVQVHSAGGDVEVAVSHDAALSITIESAGAAQLEQGKLKGRMMMACSYSLRPERANNAEQQGMTCQEHQDVCCHSSSWHC